ASVVVEVTDDTSLPKDARKRGQIAHAPHLSVPARLVKLGDKLDNLDGLTRSAPRGWGPDRVRGYFAWASAVVAGLRGVNVALEASLDEVFGRQVTVDGVSFRAISLDPDERTRVLDAYLAEMAKSVD
ncbi:MAG: hypothetical protein KAI24_12760, partial [Planctomycetes bacterium]|nr:hypothetical protein [Planctomycetota bacterium]